MDNSSKHGSTQRKGSLHRTSSQFGSLTRDIEEAVREVEAIAREAISEYSGLAKQVVGDAYNDVKSGFADSAGKAPKASKAMSKRAKLEKKTGRFASVMLLLIALSLLVAGGTGVYLASVRIWGQGLWRWPDLFLGMFLCLGGLVFLLSRNNVSKRFARYRKYYTHITGRDVVQIENLTRISGHSYRTVKRDLQAMIDHGYFEPGTYIDNDLKILVLCEKAAEDARQSAQTSGPSQETQPPGEAYGNQYMATLSELRELKVSIADVGISAKVDRIEELTAKIFRAVETSPEKTSDIRRFSGYYLPTTFKLLRSYATFEKQGIKGENITATKENIGRVLDSLITGFEQQLDQLFKADALDIATDISVLENLMQQDGLTGGKSEFKTMEGI